MQRLFLIFTSTLFVAWTAWLAYLAYTSADPVVISRPQMELAPIIVVADVKAPAEEHTQFHVQKVYRGQEKLPAARKDGLTLAWPPDLCGWRGPGTYLLALQPPQRNGEPFQMVPMPTGPGFIGLDRTDFHAQPQENIAIFHVVYPWTDSIKRQVERLLGWQGG